MPIGHFFGSSLLRNSDEHFSPQWFTIDLFSQVYSLLVCDLRSLAYPTPVSQYFSLNHILFRYSFPTISHEWIGEASGSIALHQVDPDSWPLLVTSLIYHHCTSVILLWRFLLLWTVRECPPISLHDLSLHLFGPLRPPPFTCVHQFIRFYQTLFISLNVHADLLQSLKQPFVYSEPP